MFKKIIAVVMVVILLMSGLSLVACGGNDSVRGTWESPATNAIFEYYPKTVIQFSRSNFTRWTYRPTISSRHGRVRHSQTCEESGRRILVYGFDPQYWEYAGDGLYRTIYPEIGTFSISIHQLGNQIEFVGEDGNIETAFFSQTENTITIGRRQFTRR
ncbi:MAG: hypothetical protein FWC89_07195 [Defluviitaleaceae bacterium]|nr:hypothetical protein [Defluviitaleaceae bacterium]